MNCSIIMIWVICWIHVMLYQKEEFCEATYMSIHIQNGYNNNDNSFIKWSFGVQSHYFPLSGNFILFRSYTKTSKVNLTPSYPHVWGESKQKHRVLVITQDSSDKTKGWGFKWEMKSYSVGFYEVRPLFYAKNYLLKTCL